MAWKPLSQRWASLPRIICGPILRQVTLNSVSVWVAFKESEAEAASGQFPPVYLHVFYRVGGQSIAGSSLPTPAIRFGRGIRIALMTAQLSPSLPPDAIAFYDVSFSERADLAQRALPGLLVSPGGDPVNLSWGFLRTLPVFATAPSNLSKARLLHGSCRKPHGFGRDAFEAFDIILREEMGRGDIFADPPPQFELPQALLLTGDQIYSDDVANTLLLMLRDAAQHLGIDREWIPVDGSVPLGEAGAGGSRPARESDVDPRGVVGGERSFATGAVLGFTVEQGKPGIARSHLWSLSEYILMYLFAWSDVLWPWPYGKEQEDTQALDTLAPTSDLPIPPFTNDSDVRREHEALSLFRFGLSKVRRVLANVPTYMIFDDHEITDDWMLNYEWYESAMGRAAGRHVVQNGILAYALCQAWGNAPAEFTGAKRAVIDAIQALTEPRGGSPLMSSSASRQLRDGLEGLLGSPYQAATFEAGRSAFASTGYVTPASNRIRWDYQIVAGALEVLCLDGRTQRSLKPGRYAGLVSPQGLAEQITQRRRVSGAAATIVVAPAPVFGVPLQDALQRAVAPVGAPKEGWEFDAEAWRLNPEATEELLHALLDRLPASGQIGDRPTQQRIVLLSGDVHTASVARMRYWGVANRRGVPSPPVDAVIVQLTASSFRNEEYGIKATYGLHVAPQELLDFDAGQLRTALQVGGEVSLVSSGLGGVVATAGALAVRHPRKATLVWGWPSPPPSGAQTWDGTALSASRPLVVFEPTDFDPTKYADSWDFTRAPPTWRSATRLVRSEWPPPSLTQVTFPAPAVGGVGLFARLADVLAQSSKIAAAADAEAHNGSVVGLNNAGEIRFRVQGSATPELVIHRLWWSLPRAVSLPNLPAAAALSVNEELLRRVWSVVRSSGVNTLAPSPLSVWQVSLALDGNSNTEVPLTIARLS